VGNSAYRSSAYAATRTGRVFSLFDLPPTVFTEDDLQQLGQALGKACLRGCGDVDSGYTYLGQFIAHDVSRLPPLTSNRTPGSELVQGCTPALDLDSVYGGGFHDPTVPVDPRTGKMKLGRAVDAGGAQTSADDLPRVRGSRIALIGDDRNDGNLLLAQLHLQFLKLHNFFVDCMGRDHPSWNADQLYSAARRQLILHYQEVVLFDFLERVVDPRVFEYVIVNDRGSVWDPVAGRDEARMPIEFAAAAFRFGHSMVRLNYGINDRESLKIHGLFAMTGRGGFGGASSLPDSHIVDWSLFFRSGQEPPLNLSRPIDVDVPISLPDGSTLAARHLITGNRSLLPDAQSLVRQVVELHPHLAGRTNLRPLTAAELNPIVVVAEDAGGGTRSARILDLLERNDDFEASSPLWYYVLAEAAAMNAGKRLGQLGSVIVATVLRALVRLSEPSICNVAPDRRYIDASRDIHGRTSLCMNDLLSAIRSSCA
jgi:Animal haem peroxidase